MIQKKNKKIKKGFQLGASSTDVVLILTNKKAVNTFLGNH